MGPAKGEGTEMPKWVCSLCGEVVNGSSRPKKCPSCGASKEKFEKDK
jgi:rubrerythrin